MRKEFEKYYRNDIKEQEAAGKNVYFFTSEGYEKLNELIPKIKEGDAAAENLFAEIIMPWANWNAKRYSIKLETSVDTTNVLMTTIKQIRTNPDVKDWNTFQGRFNLVMLHRAKDANRHEKLVATNHNGLSSVEAIIARGRRERYLDNSAVKKMGQQELAVELADYIESLPETYRKVLEYKLYNSNATISEMSRHLEIPEGTIKTIWMRMSKKLYADNVNNPVLGDWLHEHAITHETFAAVAEEKTSEYEAQREKIRSFFDFPSKTLQSLISSKLKISPGDVSFLFGSGSVIGGALSERTKSRMSEYLTGNGKEDKVEEFEKEFDKLREIVGHKVKRLGGFHRTEGAAR